VSLEQIATFFSGLITFIALDTLFLLSCFLILTLDAFDASSLSELKTGVRFSKHIWILPQTLTKLDLHITIGIWDLIIPILTSLSVTKIAM